MQSIILMALFFTNINEIMIARNISKLVKVLMGKISSKVETNIIIHKCDRISENQPSWRIWHIKYLVLKSSH